MQKDILLERPLLQLTRSRRGNVGAKMQPMMRKFRAKAHVILRSALIFASGPSKLRLRLPISCNLEIWGPTLVYMAGGYGKTRCCVEYCDGVGVFPIQLLTKLHVLLCSQHSLEWRANHRSANVHTAEAHLRWKSWLKESSGRAWSVQTRERQRLEHALAEQRQRMRHAELQKFREDLDASMERTETNTSNLFAPSLAKRAFQQVAGAFKRALFDDTQRVAGAVARRSPTLA